MSIFLLGDVPSDAFKFEVEELPLTSPLTRFGKVMSCCGTKVYMAISMVKIPHFLR